MDLQIICKLTVVQLQALGRGKRDVLLFTSANARQLNDASHLMTSGTLPSWLTAQDVQVRTLIPNDSSVTMICLQRTRIVVQSLLMQAEGFADG